MRVWIDGVLSDGASARISVLDHGLLYGDGLFEGMRVFGGRVFALERHLARLTAGAKALGLTLPGGPAGIEAAVHATVADHGAPEAYVRLVVTRGAGPLGVDPTTCPQPTVICIVTTLALYPEARVAAGIDLITASLRRPPADVLDPRVKTLNYVNNALAKLEARQRGADEALVLNQAGNVAEASVANVFVVRDGELKTPPGSDGALEGITRGTVLALARDLGLCAREQTLTRFDLFAGEEVFLTGSGAGIVPVRSLDARTIGTPGPVCARIRAAYWELTHRAA